MPELDEMWTASAFLRRSTYYISYWWLEFRRMTDTEPTILRHSNALVDLRTFTLSNCYTGIMPMSIGHSDDTSCHWADARGEFLPLSLSCNAFLTSHWALETARDHKSCTSRHVIGITIRTQRTIFDLIVQPAVARLTAPPRRDKGSPSPLVDPPGH